MFTFLTLFFVGTAAQAQFAGGDGTAGNPYQINSAEGLDAIRNDLDANYILIADIDLTTATGDVSGAYWNGGAGWDPIGGSSSYFTGTFNGDGFVITGLFIDRDGEHFIGLFGQTVSSKIENLALEEVAITGNRFVGGLVGFNYGTITNSYATGSMSGNRRLGGLVGENDGTITNSYATGSVSGNYDIGGLVGSNYGTITNSYATGSVSGDDDVGGLAGANIDTITDSYWNTETSGQTTGVGDGDADGVTGLTEVEMRQQSSFSGFDFDDTWQIQSGTYTSYPHLQDITYDTPGTEPEVNPIPGLFTYVPDGNNILYVDQDVDTEAAGYDGTGNSWPNAIPELRDALAWAQEWDGDADGTLQIWVAEGLYLPTDDDTDRSATFQLVNDVEAYGGFEGGESGLSDRDWNENLTILSGDVDGDDDTSEEEGITKSYSDINGGNSHHVVTGSGTDNTAILDGFTITAGRSAGGGEDENGSGMYNDGGSPALANLSFIGNWARGNGGGMYNSDSNPTLTNVTLSGNSANEGGGMYNDGSSPTLTNVTLSGNSATNSGGGMSSLFFSDPTLTNSIIWGNTASEGNEIFNYFSSSVTLTYSLYGIESGDIRGGGISADANSLTDDPVFADPENGDYTLQNTSPAINAGSNDLYEDAGGVLASDLDLAGSPRVFNGIPDPDVIDIGSYEFQGEPFSIGPDGDNILYVDQDAEGDGNGNSWPNAIPELRDALAWAQNWDGDTDGTLQIWVADGLYLPTDDDTDRSATFQLVDNVEIYGGFAGGEGSLGSRDWNSNLTILSGDIGGDDTTTDGVVTDTDNISGGNSHHVVKSSGTDDSAVLDGFTITAGLAEGTTFPTDSGAGLLNDEGAPVLAHLAITGNSANYGGGMYIGGSSPTLTNVLFAANEAEIYGGGLYITGNSAPVLTAVVVSGNSAGQGGGMYNSSSDPVITGGLFEGNSASYGGGMRNLASSPILTNVTLTGNTAGNDGGGMLNSGDEFTGESTPALRNVIIWGNLADGDSETTSASIYNIDATPAISHSLIANAFDDEDNWVSAIGSNDGNNLDITPQFVNTGDPAGADNIFGTDDDGLSLQNTSLAINAGDNDALPGGVTTDLAGNPRFFDGGTVDMGAYEFQGEPFGTPDENNILYVDRDAEGDGNGNSWANALPELRDALNWAQNWDGDADGTLQIWVAEGIYLPTDDETDRFATFQLVNDVEIYGGFDPDNGDDDFNDRDWNENLTILTGDIGGDDDNTEEGLIINYPDINGGNSHRVVNSSGTDNTAMLNGFFITAGRSAGDGLYDRGSGIYNSGGSPMLTNLTIMGNWASAFGGGMYNRGNSSPVLMNVIFSNNRAAFIGGGIYNQSDSSPTLLNVILSENSAGNAGGGIYNFGNPTLTNTIVWGNTASDNGNQIYSTSSGSITLDYSLYGNESGDINNAGTFIANNSKTVDPLFSDPANGDFTLQNTSPAINAGSNQAYTDAGGDVNNDTDLAGNPRVYDMDDGGVIDIGAYEFQGEPFSIGPDGDNILYVDQDAEGDGNGNSWANAIPELRDALVWAEDEWDGETDGTLQIWVAEGLYLPTGDGSTRTATFQLVNDVEIYGGFDPDGGADEFGERDWNENLTILSGDIDEDDDQEIITDPETQMKGANSYRVVLLDGTTKPITSSTVIDGFTITAGQEDSGISSNGGGGIRCEGSGPDGECSPVIRNTNLSGNMTLGFGGGMYIGIFNGISNPIITNVLFNNNWAKGDGGSAAGYGGGVYYYCSNGESNAVFTNVIFHGNSADREGGGIIINPETENQCSSIFTNTLFTGNSARDGGALYARIGGNATIINGTFSGNQAERKGGAVLNVAEMTIANSIFWGNSADEEANEFYNSSIGDANITNSTLNVWDSDDVASAGTLSCSSCSDLDPLFTDSANGDFTLAGNSPAINAGTNAPYESGGDAEGITTDLAGNDRILDGGTVDMGAYEFQGDPDEIPQGEDKRLLVGNQAPTVFSGNDFSLNSSVETVRIIGFSGFGSLELDGSDVGDGDEIPAEQITEDKLIFIPSESVAYGYDYAELRFQLIDDVGRVSEESATIDIDVAATSVQLTGSEGWRFLGNPSDGDSYGGFLDPIWTKGVPGSDSPGALFSNIYLLDQPNYQWEEPGDMASTTEPGRPFIVYVYGDDDNDGTPEDFPKTLTSGKNWLPLDGSFSYSGLGYGEVASNPDNFYLAANPHPVSLDFCEFTATNIGAAVTIWDPAANGGNGDYVDLSCGIDDVLIAPFQGFWVRTTDPNPVLEIPGVAYLETAESGYFKQPSKGSNPSVDGLALAFTVQSEDGIFTNTARILFSEEGTFGLDPIDAPKLSAAGLASRWLSFHSLGQDGRSYAFQALPSDFEEKVSIPLDIQTTESGSYMMEWSLPESSAFAGSYYLRDNRSGEVIELCDGADYRFAIDPTQTSKVSETLEVLESLNQSSAHFERSDGSEPRFELLIAQAGVDGFTELGAVPEEFTLAQNYPNPFNPTTVIRYQLPVNSEVRLEVYDMLGRNVATLVNGQVAAGRHTANFDASGLSSGIYLYRLAAGNQIMTRKLTVVK